MQIDGSMGLIRELIGNRVELAVYLSIFHVLDIDRKQALVLVSGSIAENGEGKLAQL